MRGYNFGHVSGLTIGFLTILFSAVSHSGEPTVNGEKELSLLGGEWSTFSEFWKEPGTAAVTANGKAKIEVKSDKLHGTCSRKTSTGTDIASEMTMSYDNKKNEHKLSLQDQLESLGKIDVKMIGKYDPSSKSYTFNGSLKENESAKETPLRLVIKNINATGFKKELWVARRDGRFAKTFEVKYTR